MTSNFFVVPSTVVAIALAAGSDARAQLPTTRANVDSAGAQSAAGSSSPAISADGRFVAFESGASDLVAGDTNGDIDVFVHDRVTGATVRVSVDSAGHEANGFSRFPTLSSDGRCVAFESYATNLVANDTNGSTDVFVHDRDPDGNGVFDEGNGVTTRVSINSAGKQATTGGYSASISADGAHVAFESNSYNLVSDKTTNTTDIFVHDLGTGVTTRVSVDSAGNEVVGPSQWSSISSDGRFVAFESISPGLVAGDTNQTRDVFLHDASTGATTRVSVDSNGGEADGPSFSASLSADGMRVVFLSDAGNLVANDTNGVRDVFVHDNSTGSTVRANVDGSGAQADLYAAHAAISGDGNVVSFASIADNLVPPDDNFRTDCFLRDLSQGTTILVSRDPTTRPGDGECYTPVSNADGSVIAFISGADDLVANDTNGTLDVFVYDRTVTPLQAAWANYGAGLAGSLGVPSLALSADPEFGATFSLQVGNSSGNWSVAFVAVGTTRASLPIRGGTLLLLPSQILPFGLPPSGIPVDCTVPYDTGLFGFVLDVQAIEMDPGASRGLSFTPGLELVFGQ